MINFLSGLFSSNEKQVDSLNVIGVASTGVMLGLSVATFVHSGQFEPMTVAGGAATIIGAVGGGRRVRDGSGQSGAQGASG